MNITELILGPPGCGKTTYCIATLEAEFLAGIKPDRVLYSTFTKRGANEAIVRSCEKFKFKRDQLPYFRTLHSLAFQQMQVSREDVMQWRDYKRLGEVLGLDFGYIDLEDGMPVPTANKGDNMLYLLGLSRAKMITPEEQFKDSDFDFEWFEFKRFIDTLTEYKEKRGLLDFSDMIDLYIKDGKPLKVDVGLIDEAQDLSKQQWTMVRKALSGAERVYIAGDDDQAIFKWSGADVDSFLQLEGNKKVLDHSYRLPRSVHEMACKITNRIRHRYEKKWSPRDDEGSVDYVNGLDDMEIREGKNLLLARNKYMLKKFEEKLRAYGMPYTTSRGSSIDPESITAIKAWESLRKGDTLPIDLIRTAYQHLKVGTGVKRGFKSLKGAPQELNMSQLTENWGLLTDAIWHDALQGLDNSEYYLAVLRSGEKLTGEPRVHISTIHGVKGGEADHVSILSDVSWKTYKGYQENPDDENRVMYVAATRARKTLQIILPETNIFYDFP